MASTYTIISGTGSATYEISTGARGPAPTASQYTEALQGAAGDATRIGAEYLPEEIEVVSVQLADTSGSALAVGRLGLNANNQLIIHDNLRNGSDIAPLLDANSHQGQIAKITAEQAVTADYKKVLVSFKLPAALITAGRHIALVGDLLWVNGFGVQPDIGVYLGVRKKGETDSGKFAYVTLSPDTGTHRYSFNMPIILDTGSVASLAVGSTIATKTVLPAAAGAITSHTGAWVAADDLSFPANADDLFTLGQKLDWELFFWSLNGSAVVTSFSIISLSCSLVAEQ
jgi:hypothetical protein